MKASLSDVHGSHGSVFTLRLQGQDEDDREVLEFLDKQRKMVENPEYRKRIFYIYKFKTYKNSCEIGFSESGVDMAKVDGMFNFERNDQKYPVAVLDHLRDEKSDRVMDRFNRPKCHWCEKEVSEFDRISIEVLVKTGTDFKKERVDVHKKCQDLREAQMALIPFPKEVLSATAGPK